MKVSSLLAAAALIACALLSILLFRAREEAGSAKAQLQSLSAENTELAARIAELEKSRLDEATLTRLQADQREAIKLRADVANLKKSVASAEAAAASARKAAGAKPAATEPQRATIPPEQNPEVRLHNAKGVANVPPGHAMIVGGWETKPGRRTFAFMSPTLDPANPQTVAVQAKLLEMSSEAAAQLNLSAFLPGAGQQSTITDEQFQSFVKQLEQTAGVDILSAPTVTTASGRQAQIAVSHAWPTAAGYVDMGPSINLIPTQRPDGTIDLAVDATLTLPTDEAP